MDVSGCDNGSRDLCDLLVGYNLGRVLQGLNRFPAVPDFEKLTGVLTEQIRPLDQKLQKQMDRLLKADHLAVSKKGEAGRIEVLAFSFADSNENSSVSADKEILNQ
jgi:hypothetical protein